MGTFTGTTGPDDLLGTTGNDDFLLLAGDTNGLDQYDGLDGIDTIRAPYGGTTLHVENALANLHSIEAIGGFGLWWTNTILATPGNDTLDFSDYTVTNFLIDGGDGNDTITGTDGDDHIR